MAGPLKRIIPLLDRILVEKVVAPTKSAGGVLLPQTTSAGKLPTGTVIAVGSGTRCLDGSIAPLSVKEGETVLLPEFGGQEVKMGEKIMHIYRNDDIVAVLKE